MCIVCVLTWSLLGVKKSLGYAQIGLLQGFNSKFPTSIPTPFICRVSSPPRDTWARFFSKRPCMQLSFGKTKPSTPQGTLCSCSFYKFYYNSDTKKNKFEAIMWSVQIRLPKQRRQESLERCSEIQSRMLLNFALSNASKSEK